MRRDTSIVDVTEYFYRRTKLKVGFKVVQTKRWRGEAKPNHVGNVETVIDLDMAPTGMMLVSLSCGDDDYGHEMDYRWFKDHFKRDGKEK